MSTLQLQKLPFFIIALGVCVVEAGVIGVRMPKKVQEWTDRCRLTVQRCKFIYKLWSKCRNKKNFDNLIRSGGLDAFSDKIMDFMKCDPVSIANRLEIPSGIKGRAKTKIMRMSLTLLIEEIKKGFERNMPYIHNTQRGIQKYTVNAIQRIC